MTDLPAIWLWQSENAVRPLSEWPALNFRFFPS